MPQHTVEPVHPVDPRSPGAERLTRLGGRLQTHIAAAYERALGESRGPGGHSLSFKPGSLQQPIRDAAAKYSATLPEYFNKWTTSAEMYYRLSNNADPKFADLVSRSLADIGKGLNEHLKSWAEVTSPERAYDPDGIADVAEKVMGSLDQAWKVVKFDFGEVAFKDRSRLTYGARLDAALVGLAEQIHQRLTEIGGGKVVDRITMEAEVKQLVDRAQQDPVASELEAAVSKAYGEEDLAKKAVTKMTDTLTALRNELQQAQKTVDSGHATEEEVTRAKEALRTLPLQITSQQESLQNKQQVQASKKADKIAATQRVNSYAAALRDAHMAVAGRKPEEIWQTTREALVGGLETLERPDLKARLGTAFGQDNLAEQLAKWRTAKSATPLDAPDLQAKATSLVNILDRYHAAVDATLAGQDAKAVALWEQGLAAIAAIRARILIELDAFFKRGAFERV